MMMMVKMQERHNMTKAFLFVLSRVLTWRQARVSREFGGVDAIC